MRDGGSEVVPKPKDDMSEEDLVMFGDRHDACRMAGEKDRHCYQCQKCRGRWGSAVLLWQRSAPVRV